MNNEDYTRTYEELQELVISQEKLIRRLEDKLTAKDIVIKCLRGIKEDKIVISTPKQKGTKKRSIKLSKGHLKAIKFFKAMPNNEFSYLDIQAECGHHYTMRPYVGELAECNIIEMVGRDNRNRMVFKFNSKWNAANPDFIAAVGVTVPYKKQA